LITIKVIIAAVFPYKKHEITSFIISVQGNIKYKDMSREDYVLLISFFYVEGCMTLQKIKVYIVTRNA